MLEELVLTFTNKPHIFIFSLFRRNGVSMSSDSIKILERGERSDKETN